MLCKIRHVIACMVKYFVRVVALINKVITVLHHMFSTPPFSQYLEMMHYLTGIIGDVFQKPVPCACWHSSTQVIFPEVLYLRENNC